MQSPLTSLLFSLSTLLYCHEEQSNVSCGLGEGEGRGGVVALVFLPPQTTGINLDDSFRSCQAGAPHQLAAGEVRHLVHQCEGSQRRLKIHSGG